MQAETGIHNLREEVDSLITIPNDRLLQVVERIPLLMMPSASLTISSVRAYRAFLT